MQDVKALEGIEYLRTLYCGAGEAIPREVGASEALCVREVSIAENTTLVVVFIYVITLHIGRFGAFFHRTALVVLARLFDVVILLVGVHVIVAQEVLSVGNVCHFHVLA